MANADFMMSNYAAVFIDLLGQRAELLRSGDLLPDNHDEAVKLAKGSIGAVRWLHDRFDTFYEGLSTDPTEGDPTLGHPRAKEIRAVALKYQRFSDGLVMYLSLYGHPPKPEVMNGVYGLVTASGALALMGLTEGRPIRGGLAVGWGAEVSENELYGAVMARAYQLESEIAKHPRVVVSEHLPGYLQSVIEVPGDDMALRYCRDLAKVTLSFLAKDRDRAVIVDYLGESFRKHIGKGLDKDAYKDALTFVVSERDRFRRERNRKLEERYHTVADYFGSRGFTA